MPNQPGTEWLASPTPHTHQINQYPQINIRQWPQSQVMGEIYIERHLPKMYIGSHHGSCHLRRTGVGTIRQPLYPCTAPSRSCHRQRFEDWVSGQLLVHIQIGTIIIVHMWENQERLTFRPASRCVPVSLSCYQHNCKIKQ